jgi:hypothetical protein
MSSVSIRARESLAIEIIGSYMRYTYPIHMFFSKIKGFYAKSLRVMEKVQGEGSGVRHG